MTWWQLLGAGSVSFLATVLGCLVAWRRGVTAGREFEFRLGVRDNVTRQMIADSRDCSELLASIAKIGGGRT